MEVTKRKKVEIVMILINLKEKEVRIFQKSTIIYFQ